MKEITIQENEAGKRFDKFLSQYLSKAPSSFLYKMLRKKNITLNEKKADGSEKLCTGDLVKFWLSDETFEKFASDNLLAAQQGKEIPTAQYRRAYKDLKGITVIYENHHVLFVNKPAGILTQKAEPQDVSLNEWLIGYLLKSGEITPESLITFRPSVCNRLDRNTSGLVICAKTLPGAQRMADCLKERTMQKFYRTVVSGIVSAPADIKGYLIKDERTNRVTVSKEQSGDAESAIETSYAPLAVNQKDNLTYLEVELKTGKTHQIRAHLASIGHPLVGDFKYGAAQVNEKFRSTYGVKAQLLHSFRVFFPDMPEGFEDLSGKEIIAPLPDKLQQIVNEKFK